MANIGLPSGREQVVEIKIPAGVRDGSVLRLTGMGDDTIAHAPRGDIHLTINVSQHQRFIRQDDDLICGMEISCIDAMIGKTFQIDTIDFRILRKCDPFGVLMRWILVIKDHTTGLT